MKAVSNPAELATLIEAGSSRYDCFFVAVSGPPGSGKSTLADNLQRHINRPACVVPMDGFHLDNTTLAARGLLERKGAPETFDLAGFTDLVDNLRHFRTRHYPTFDRKADAVVPGGGSVPPGTEILIFEGNYLLLDEPGWADLNRKWDGSVWIDVPDRVLEDRLIRRWRDHGFSQETARKRAAQNDMKNAKRVKLSALTPTWTIAT